MSSVKKGVPIGRAMKFFLDYFGRTVKDRTLQTPKGAFPMQAGYKPIRVELQKGKEYAWCACGLSKD